MRALLLLLALAFFCHSQISYPGCADVTDADFTSDFLVSQTNDPDILAPLKMDFDMDAGGNVNIYFIEKRGNVKLFDPLTNTVSIVGKIDVTEGLHSTTSDEDGLHGIALHPSFKTTGWIFFYYSKDSDFRVSRFTLNHSNMQLDLGSELVYLTIPSSRARWHTAGDLKFDDYGDLWISVGDNETAEKGPANTADLRGSILRIHPNDNGTYTIPQGNLWEKAAAYFQTSLPNISSQYKDSLKMKREIYVMGTRNAYTIGLDPYRRWIMYGDCGPDFVGESEEHNLFVEPEFAGWPYWSGKTYEMPQIANRYDEQGETYWGAGTKNMSAPMNLNPNISGIPNLLPAAPAIHPYDHSCAMNGPLYRYDGDLQSSVKLPPHFNRKWFIGDFNLPGIKMITVTEDGQNMVGSPMEIFKTQSNSFGRPLDIRAGPDGALYFLSYSRALWRTVDQFTGIFKISYNGSCRPDSPKLEKVVGVNEKNIFTKFDILTNGIIISENGPHSLNVYDVSGELLNTIDGTGKATYKMNDFINSNQKGVFILQLKTSSGTQLNKYYQ